MNSIRNPYINIRNLYANVSDMLKSLKFVCLGCLILAGCEDSQSGPETPLQTAKAVPLGTPSNDGPAAKKNDEPVERMIAGVKFEFPPGWEEKAVANTMIAGEYSLPGEAGPGRLTFSTAGGGTAANMDRWKTQFRRGPDDPEPKESQITAAGKEATLIEVAGAYSDMFGGGGPKPNWQLLGVAIPIDSDHNYFVKLTGPRETVSARRDEFLKFIKSARFE